MENNFVSVSTATVLLLELIKRFKIKINGAYYPLLAIALAAVINTALSFVSAGAGAATFDFWAHLKAGAAAGLVASGGYDAVAAVFRKSVTAERGAEPEAAAEPWAAMEQGENV